MTATAPATRASGAGEWAPEHDDVEPARVSCPRCGAGRSVLVGGEGGCVRCGGTDGKQAAVSCRADRLAPPAAVRVMRNGPVCVLAWSLAEGDVLPGGERVLLVRRDPERGVVSVATDDDMQRRHGRQDRVMVARRAAEVVLPGWRVGSFVTAARGGRQRTSPDAASGEAAPARPDGGRRG